MVLIRRDKIFIFLSQNSNFCFQKIFFVRFLMDPKFFVLLQKELFFKFVLFLMELFSTFVPVSMELFQKSGRCKRSNNIINLWNYGLNITFRDSKALLIFFSLKVFRITPFPVEFWYLNLKLTKYKVPLRLGQTPFFFSLLWDKSQKLGIFVPFWIGQKIFLIFCPFTLELFFVPSYQHHTVIKK